MKSRAEAASFINSQIAGYSPEEGSTKIHHHYGREELRELLDFLYHDGPKCDDEKIHGGAWGHSYKLKPGKIN